MSTDDKTEAALAASAGAVPAGYVLMPREFADDQFEAAMDGIRDLRARMPHGALSDDTIVSAGYDLLVSVAALAPSAASQLGSTQDPPPGDWSTDIREGRAASQPSADARDAAVDGFLDEVRAELIRARAKFPGDRIMTLALAEEFGELCKAVLDESASCVRKEAVQTAVMAARVALDGDGSVRDWRRGRGLDPLTDAAIAAASQPSADARDAWVPVSERLPPLGELVFVSSSGVLSVMARGHVDDEGWYWVRQSWAWNLADPAGLEFDDDYQPTHWMPLQTPPAADGQPSEGPTP